MKVWGVRNFYSHLERVSEEGSEFSMGYFALVATSALLATGGLLANSVVVIIGSMCIAPFLGASRAVSVGAVYKKWNTVGKGLLKQILGLLAIGSTLAFLVTLAFSHFLPDIIVTPEIMARTLPTLKDVYLAMFIATSSGIAASLALVVTPRIVSEPWQELLDAMIGVEISISLIPPASILGIGLALGLVDVSIHSFYLLLINIVGLNFIGSMSVLYLWRIEPKLLHIEKGIREITERVINKVVKTDSVLTEVVLHSYDKADVHVNLFCHAFEIHEHEDLAELAKKVSREIKKETGVSNNVKIIVTPIHVYTS